MSSQKIHNLLNEAAKVKLFDDIKSSQDLGLVVDVLEKLFDQINTVHELYKKSPPKLRVKLEDVDIIQIKGDKGDKGEEGMMGPRGYDGIKGVDGKNGTDGKDGKDGIDGESITGPQGRHGEDGIQGLPGKDGSPDTPAQIRKKILPIEIDDVIGLWDELKKIRKQGSQIFMGGSAQRAPIILNAAETPNGSITAFTFAYKPVEIVSDGISMVESGGWTWSGSIATLSIPPQDKIYGRA